MSESSPDKFRDEIEALEREHRVLWSKAEKMARAKLARLPNAHLDILQEQRIVVRRLENPLDYFCVNGHVLQIPDRNVKAPRTCFRCGDRIIWDCRCGASLDLWFNYLPPYDMPIAGRDYCYSCKKLCPWSERWLFSPKGDLESDIYESKLIDHIPGYPEFNSYLNKFGLSTEDLKTCIFPKWWDFSRGNSITIEHEHHPKHQQLLKARELHAADLAVFQAKISARKRRVHTQHLKLMGDVHFWKSLTGPEFEIELAKLLRSRGYHVSRVGGIGDGGIDLIISHASDSILVQCKAHAKIVGPGAVRDFYGAMIHKNASEGWLVCIEGFSSAAREFARGKSIKLYTVDQVLALPICSKIIP